MATVVCVRQGKKYTPEYVTMLQRMVFQYLGAELVTFTDQIDTPGKIIPLQSQYKGWWAKLELFAPWNRHLRPFIYFDLDTFIVSPVDWEPDDNLWLIRDFYRDYRSNSGVMMVPRETGMLWEFGQTFCRENPRLGDGDFLTTVPHKVLQDHFDGIVSYKVHCADAMNTNSKVICFHGHPKPHHVNGWAGELWNRWN